MPSDFNNKMIRIGDRWLAPFLLLIAIIASAFTINGILSLPGEISFNRLALLSIPIITGFFCLALLVFILKDFPRTQKQIARVTTNPLLSKKIDKILPILWLFFLIIGFLSFSSLGRWMAAYARINSILQFAFLLATELWIFWLFLTRRTNNLQGNTDNQPRIVRFVFAGCIALIWLVVFITGKGIGIGTQYWGKAGIPVLHWQLGVAWGMLLFCFWINRRKKYSHFHTHPWLMDVLIFGALWITAFLIWQNIPVTISRYVANAYPPNYVNYPYSDAGDYALQAESIQVGNGFAYGFIDKPLHLTFLSFLSLLAGSNFSQTILFQVGFLSIIPGLIYLIASRLTSRPVGLMTGLIALFMQNNNLAIANRIQATNVKMTMSESLTGMMLMLVCLAVIAWWKKPAGSRAYPALAGSLLGLSALVRLNVLVIFPCILVTWLLFFGLKKRLTWMAALIFSVFCLLSQVPWGIRNQIVLGSPFHSFSSKAEGVVFKHRIDPIITAADNPDKDENQTNQIVESDTQPSQAAGLMGLFEPMEHTGLHNLITVGLTLPAYPLHTGLDETIRLPYWDQEWDGTFPSGGQFIFAGSLLLVGLGFSIGWKNCRVIAAVPFIILMSYLAANTVSLVSGGRYIIPVDWVVPMYYSFGTAGIIIWLLRLDPDENRTNEKRNEAEVSRKYNLPGSWILVSIALIISCLPAVLSLGIPKKYLPVDNSTVFAEIESIHPELPINLTWQELKEFSKDKDAVFKPGKAMFPRWMKSGEGDTGGSGSAFSALPFDHLSFSVISDDYLPFDAVLPINSPIQYLPNSMDVILVGCNSASYFDAIMVILRMEEPIVYTRPDISHLTCPLPLP